MTAGSSTATNALSPTHRSPICSSSSRAPGPPTTTAPESRSFWCLRTPRAFDVGVKDAKMGQEGAWTADVNFTDVRVARQRADRRQRGHRLPGSDDVVGPWPGPHRRTGCRDRATRARRIRRLRRNSHTGRETDRDFPTRTGDARRPADGRHGRTRTGPRHRATLAHRRGPQDRAVGGQAVLHRNGRQGSRSRGAGTRRQRLHARGPGRADLSRRSAAAVVRGHQ